MHNGLHQTSRRPWVPVFTGMTTLLLCAVTAFALEPLPKDAVPAPQAVFNFDRDALGKPPQRFALAVTGEGPDVHWEVRQDPQAPSQPNDLVQSGRTRPGENFALAILDNVMLEHGEMSVRFKAISGEEDQAAGIVYRYKDPQNYYAIIASSREDSCTFYRVKKGKLKQLDSKLVIISPLTWHELRITFANKNYTALIDGDSVIGGKDPSFKGPGLVGLLTKSDSVIAFDDFHISQ